MNILVTGANGQLGTELRNITAGSRNRYIFSDVISLPGVETVNLDITNIEAIRIICESERIDVIVNCAAYTNVDKAEDDTQMAMLINSTAAGRGTGSNPDTYFYGLCIQRTHRHPIQGRPSHRTPRSIWIHQARR